jgi:hypothetical protein
MSDSTRPTIDPEPGNTGADFTATATASPDAWQRLTDSLARNEAKFAARDAAEKDSKR